MIAIPLQENHDLLLELESVQRAILYHCPLLINACVASVLTRMPLLYVDARSQKEANGGDWSGAQEFFQASKKSPGWMGREDDLLTSRDPVTQTLFSIVESVVQEYMFQPQTVPPSLEEEEEESRNGLNAQQIQPLLIPFQGLELEDGRQQDNEVLYAIGQESEGTQILRTIIDEISRRVEDQGWKVYLPLDDPQGGHSEDHEEWRPRIPFVRLPPNFVESLPDPKGWDGKWAEYTIEEQRSYIRLPEEGGNGISPIFWFNFMEDEFCDGNAVRYVSRKGRIVRGMILDEI